MDWLELRSKATPIAISKGFNQERSLIIQELIRSEACLEVFHGPSKFAVGDWVTDSTSFMGNKSWKLVTEIRWSDGYEYVTEAAGVVRARKEVELITYDAWVPDPFQARRLAEKRYL